MLIFVDDSISILSDKEENSGSENDIEVSTSEGG
jgi:hypothetical protein